MFRPPEIKEYGYPVDERNLVDEQTDTVAIRGARFKNNGQVTKVSVYTESAGNITFLIAKKTGVANQHKITRKVVLTSTGKGETTVRCSSHTTILE